MAVNEGLSDSARRVPPVMDTNAVTEKFEVVCDAASARYRARGDARQITEARLDSEGVESVEDAGRVSARRALLNPNDGLALERIFGANDLLSVNYLELGQRAARSVCRVQVRDLSGRSRGFGTGFLVAPGLLLTNQHVLATRDNARRSLAEFNFEDDLDFLPRNSSVYRLEPDRVFYADRDMDFTFVAVSELATDGTPLTDYGFLPLVEFTGKALKGEWVSIIQHPSGGAKQVALRDNQVLDVFDDYVHYSTDTLPGSSGSPVLNDQWQVVALHHAGVQARDRQGRVLAVDGRLWRPAMGEAQVAWVANEGIRISSIFDRLESLRTDSADVERILSLLRRPAQAPVVLATPAPVVEEGVERGLEFYANSAGYDPDFLSVRVDLPGLPDDRQADIAPLRDGGQVLRYTHFSVVMSRSRRLAYFTAVNINGAQSRTVTRRGSRWYFDPRMDRAFQSGPDLYSRNELDRGHLVRRLDPVWGAEAEEANEDTFHYTNAAPQHSGLNQRSWLDLENYILENADDRDLRVSVFTGPVFRADDMLYRREYQIPAEFWKIAVMIRPDGQPSATAYLQTQKNLIENLEFAYGAYRTYQVPVTRIEELTELDFGALRTFDPIAAIEATLGFEITSARDVRL